MNTETTLDAFWRRCAARHGLTGPRPPLRAFGDSKSQQNELANLVVTGRKRATAGLALWYGYDRETAPKPGDLHIFTDGSGTPRGIIRITEIREAPFNSVDDQFAHDEGEGDRSRAYWLAEHHRFFAAELAREGLAMADTVKVMFQRFEHLDCPDI